LKDLEHGGPCSRQSAEEYYALQPVDFLQHDEGEDQMIEGNDLIGLVSWNVWFRDFRLYLFGLAESK
jgi:hypothetical protein